MIDDSPAHTLIPPYRCHDCGSTEGFRSRRRSLIERIILPVMLLKPVRCGECFRRDYRLILTRVHDRLSETSGMVRVKPQPGPSRRNVA